MRKKNQILLILFTVFTLSMVPLKVQYDYLTLGQWDVNGKPQYLDGRIPVSTDLIDRTRQLIQDSLVMSGNEFLNRNAANIFLRGEGEVFVTLLYEDAGWRNTLGFYTYDVNNIPQTIDELGDLTIIFPNIDTPGIVDGGMRISLGTYPENTVFGFFLVAEGWNNGITNGNYTLYTNDDFNEDLTSSTFYNQMTIIFPNDISTSKIYDLLLCMEDNVDLNLGDYDYNDAVFQIESSPASVLDQLRHDENQPPIARDTLFYVYPNGSSNFSIDSLLYEPDDYLDYTSLEVITTVDPSKVDNVFFTGTSLSVEVSDGIFDTLSIDYKVCDTGFPTLCDTGTIQIVLGDLNLPPIATEDSVINYSEDLTTIGIPLSQLGYDPDNNLDPSHLKIIPSDNDVFFSLVDNNNLKIVPNLSATGMDTVFFEICDLGFPIYCEVGFLIINIPVVPIAVNDTVRILSGEEEYIDVLRNDTHPDNDIDATSLTIIEGPSISEVTTVVEDGRILHNSEDNFVGSYDIRYEICDNSTPPDCDQATLTVIVYNDDTVIVEENLPPIAKNDFVYTDINQSVEINILDNDYDQDDRLDYFSVSIISSPLNGSVLLDGEINGSDTTIVAHYFPKKGFEGVDIFSYKVSDFGNPILSDEAIVIIYIGDEGFNADNSPLYWVDSVEIDEGESHIHMFQNYLDDSDIDFTSSGTSVYGSPDLLGASVELMDDVTIRYNAPDSIDADKVKDYVYYKVCNDADDCGYGLLIVNVVKEDTTAKEEIDITIYNGFSPNNDNINDYFIIDNLDNYPNNDVKIYNRWGQEIYKKDSYVNDWEGINNSGQPLPDGTYFYILSITHNDELYSFNGYVVIKR